MPLPGRRPQGFLWRTMYKAVIAAHVFVRVPTACRRDANDLRIAQMQRLALPRVCPLHFGAPLPVLPEVRARAGALA